MDKGRTGKTIIESVIVGLLVFIITVSNILSSLDYMIKDALYQIPRGVNNQIKIIGIDERTLEVLGPVNTWSRQVYADLLDILNSDDTAKPAVIGFDILFSGEVDAEGDEAFAKECEESGNVVVASQFVYDDKAEIDDEGVIVFPIEAAVLPYEALKDVTIQGYANVAQDSDAVVRRVQLKENFNGQEYQMFSKAIYQLYCEKNNFSQNETVTDKYGRMRINYSGKPGDYECISLIDVLEGKIDSRAFQESIVIVGAYSNGMQDNFNVPNGGSEQMFGVEIHANILQAFLQNRFSIDANPYVTGLILGVIAGLCHALFRRNKVWLSTVVLVVVITLELLTGWYLNNHGTAIGLVSMPVMLLVSYVYCLAIGYIVERIKKNKVLGAFKKYVAAEIVDEISKKGDFHIALSGENRDIAVLFVDIRGFTTMSEVLEPEQVVEILNQYLGLTTQAIFKNKGTLDKFIGDATMAVFNSPFDLDDYEFRAVCAAMDIVEAGALLEEKLLKEYGRTVGFGVGVNCGSAVVGNIGCEFRMDYTAIGDTVNTAARLESNAKKGQVLISDVLYERVKDRIEVEPIGEIPLKGKSKGVFVYSVKSVRKG
ncbi:MAG: adenylate/guanylate cyclase domain-containing protein [Lachnospiraceae bacterium]|nr:adenylate/guanylate cyclase domain-containing protein [Lachnospiraceae bacterium]